MSINNFIFNLIILYQILSFTNSNEMNANPSPVDPKKQCQTDKDCNNGFCDSNSICNCNLGFIDYIDTSGKYNRCSYEQKSQMRAFLYELFINFGAGHFYLNRTKIGYLKLSSFLFGLFLICLFPLTIKFLNDKFEGDFCVILFSCVYYYYAVGLAFWYIYDLVSFGMNTYLDGNGMPLRSW